MFFEEITERLKQFKREIETTEKEIWKPAITYVELAIKDATRNRFFEFNAVIRTILYCTDGMDENGKEDEIFKRLLYIQVDAENYYKELVQEYFRNKTNISAEKINEIIPRLEGKTILYEQLVNYILAGEKYENSEVEIGGETVSSLQEKMGIDMLSAYKYMMHLYEIELEKRIAKRRAEREQKAAEKPQK